MFLINIIEKKKKKIMYYIYLFNTITRTVFVAFMKEEKL